MYLFSDKNECTLGTHNCHNNATCNNTQGSFTCACNTGYFGNGVNCTGRKIICVVSKYSFCPCILKLFLDVVFLRYYCRVCLKVIISGIVLTLCSDHVIVSR